MNKLARDNGLYDKLEEKIRILASTAWHDRWSNDSDRLCGWLNNFLPNEQLEALFLLSRFIYYDCDSVRVLLKRIYEEVVRRPIIYSIRKENLDNLDEQFIENEYSKRLSRVRFLCIGNPSESSSMMLYLFRQENNLHLEQFISIDKLYRIKKTRDSLEADLSLEGVDRIFVIDDFCATGSQAKSFSDNHVQNIKNSKSDINVTYVSLVGTDVGDKMLANLAYDEYHFGIYLDNSYHVFLNDSRFFTHDTYSGITRENCKRICKKYGQKLFAHNPLGYKNSQLIIGFYHNTPNNTLPIFWSSLNDWSPIFKRYPKIY